MTHAGLLKVKRGNFDDEEGFCTVCVDLISDFDFYTVGYYQPHAEYFSAFRGCRVSPASVNNTLLKSVRA